MHFLTRPGPRRFFIESRQSSMLCNSKIDPGTWGSHATLVKDILVFSRLADGIRLRLHRRPGDYPTRHTWADWRPGKSTKAEVTARLGFPALVTYGRKGAETWDYYYVTEYPQASISSRGERLSPGFQADHPGVDGQLRSPGSGPKSPDEPDDRPGGDLSLLGLRRRAAPPLPPPSFPPGTPSPLPV